MLITIIIYFFKGICDLDVNKLFFDAELIELNISMFLSYYSFKT